MSATGRMHLTRLTDETRPGRYFAYLFGRRGEYVSVWDLFRDVEMSLSVATDMSNINAQLRLDPDWAGWEVVYKGVRVGKKTHSYYGLMEHCDG